MAKDEIILIIDKSGSMDAIKSFAIEGFNAFLDQQRQVERSANVTLVLFDHRYHLIHNGIDIHKVENLQNSNYKPSGTTALLDAVGRTVDRVGERLDSLEESQKPENVIVFILTDGLENSSSDYSRRKVRNMIEHQESKYSWEFIYGGANQDAFAEAGGLGIKRKNTFNFDATAEGTKVAYEESSKIMESYRTGTITDE